MLGGSGQSTTVSNLLSPGRPQSHCTCWRAPNHAQIYSNHLGEWHTQGVDSVGIKALLK